MTASPTWEQWATHEAGHCVIGTELGWDLEFVYLEAEEEEHMGGHTSFSPPDWFDLSRAADDPRVRSRIRETAVVVAGGLLAQDVIAGVPLSRGEAGYDSSEIQRLLPHIEQMGEKPSLFLVQALSDATELLSAPVIRRKVNALTGALLQTHCVSGPEARRVIAGAS